MSAVDSSCSKTLNFQSPTNLNAIRSTLLKRIHQKRQENSLAPQASLSTSPMSMSMSSTTFSCPPLISATKIPSLLDHGLPSPPVEYQKKQQVNAMDIDGQQEQGDDDDDEDDAVSTISSLPPTNNSASLAALDASSMSLSSSATPASLPTESWNAQQLELKIKQLKEEKHQLFTQMKNLLQQEEKPTTTTTVQLTRPSPLKTTCFLPDNDKTTQQPSLPSPSPSPTSTPKTMNLQAKQKMVLKPTSLPSSRSSSHHTNNNHPHAFHYPQQQYRRRRSSLTSNNCLSAAAAAAMMTTPRYYPHSPTLSFGTSSANNNNNNNNNSNMISSNSSSMTMDNNGRYRYSPYGVYFTPISSPPSGYNVRRPSYLSSRSTSSFPSTTSTIPTSSNTFRPSRSLVNRHNPRY